MSRCLESMQSAAAAATANHKKRRRELQPLVNRSSASTQRGRPAAATNGTHRSQPSQDDSSDSDAFESDDGGADSDDARYAPVSSSRAIDPASIESRRLVSVDDASWRCPICLSAWTCVGTHKICTLPCGHLYGRSCIQRWLTTHRQCPQCKRSCRPNQIIQIYAQHALPVLALPNDPKAPQQKQQPQSYHALRHANGNGMLYAGQTPNVIQQTTMPNQPMAAAQMSTSLSTSIASSLTVATESTVQSAFFDGSHATDASVSKEVSTAVAATAKAAAASKSSFTPPAASPFDLDFLPDSAFMELTCSQFMQPNTAASVSAASATLDEQQSNQTHPHPQSPGGGGFIPTESQTYDAASNSMTMTGQVDPLSCAMATGDGASGAVIDSLAFEPGVQSTSSVFQPPPQLPRSLSDNATATTLTAESAHIDRPVVNCFGSGSTLSRRQPAASKSLPALPAGPYTYTRKPLGSVQGNQTQSHTQSQPQTA